MNSDHFDRANSKADELRTRLVWAGAVSNGALVLALIAFAGGADDVFAAVRAASAALGLGVVGFAAGALAILFGAVDQDAATHWAIGRDTLERATKRQVMAQELLSAPPAEPKTTEFSRQRAQAALEEARELAKEAEQEMGTALAAMERNGKSAGVALAVSFLCACASLIALLVAAWTAP